MSSLAPTPTSTPKTLAAFMPTAPSAGRPAVLDSSHIDYYARSFGDPISRLFWHEGALHLGVLPQYGQRFTDFLESTVFGSLVSEGLLFGATQTVICPEVFETTFRLDHTPRINYWHEWSPVMAQTAALRMIDLLTQLIRNDLILRNPHPWNLLFDGHQFSYANAGSVVPFDANTFVRSYEKIAQYFVRPLLLLAHGQEHTARRLVSDPREGALAADIDHLGCSWCDWDSERQAGREIAFLEEIASSLGGLKAEAGPQRWIDYFETDCDFGPGTSWTRKQEALLLMLRDPTIQSVLDLGANTGHYAKLAAEHGREAIATDFDPALVHRIYAGALSNALPIYPAVLDFVYPSEAEGVDYRWFPPATTRYSADLVLCFALAHHMVFGRYRLDFEQIARGVRSFSRGWALVEYVERGKIQPSEWRPDADSWYSAETFAAVLRKHFPLVEILPPANDGRRLLVCGPERRLP